jgi:hypothetical protein
MLGVGRRFVFALRSVGGAAVDAAIRRLLWMIALSQVYTFTKAALTALSSAPFEPVNAFALANMVTPRPWNQKWVNSMTMALTV